MLVDKIKSDVIKKLKYSEYFSVALPDSESNHTEEVRNMLKELVRIDCFRRISGGVCWDVKRIKEEVNGTSRCNSRI